MTRRYYHGVDEGNSLIWLSGQARQANRTWLAAVQPLNLIPPVDAMAADACDLPWKNALMRYFPEFVAFYFPSAHAAIDWCRPHAFLDQELAQVVRDGALGARLVDKLVQVAVIGGGDQWVYIHIEVQGRSERAFSERVFVYNYRLFDRFRRPVASLALLVEWHGRPMANQFGYCLFGCEMGFRFPIVKLSAYAEHMDELLHDANPFALITAAHLMTQQTRRDDVQRKRAKWRLTRLLYERNWARQEIIDLFSIIDWLMRLPPELEQALRRRITAYERRHEVPYITSIERLGRAEGKAEGKAEGLFEGKSEGLTEGEH